MHSKFTKIGSGVVVVAVAFVVGAYVGKLVWGDSSTGSNASSNSTKSEPVKTENLTTVLASPTKYTGQTVTVKGQVYKAGSDYYLVEPSSNPAQPPSKDSPNSIKLDSSQANIDLSKYANAGSTTQTTAPGPKPSSLKPAVTITGQITSSNQQPVLVVSSVSS